MSRRSASEDENYIYGRDAVEPHNHGAWAAINVLY